MKKEYQKPEIEVYEIEVEDIITASGTAKLGKTLPGFEDDNTLLK